MTEIPILPFFQFSRTVSYHLECLTFPPETQRPSSPPPASPASGPGSPGILHWRKPPQPALTRPPTPLNTPSALSQPFTCFSGLSKFKRKLRSLTASVDLPGNKDLENCVTKAVGHRAAATAELPLQISSASSSSGCRPPPRQSQNPQTTSNLLASS